MYSRACTGFQALLGPSSNECQRIERSIASLDATQGKCRDISISFAHISSTNLKQQVRVIAKVEAHGRVEVADTVLDHHVQEAWELRKIYA
jgi:hypothetical protein